MEVGSHSSVRAVIASSALLHLVILVTASARMGCDHEVIYAYNSGRGTPVVRSTVPFHRSHSRALTKRVVLDSFDDQYQLLHTNFTF